MPLPADESQINEKRKRLVLDAKMQYVFLPSHRALSLQTMLKKNGFLPIQNMEKYPSYKGDHRGAMVYGANVASDLSATSDGSLLRMNEE